jgi:hypothetical protein
MSEIYGVNLADKVNPAVTGEYENAWVPKKGNGGLIGPVGSYDSGTVRKVRFESSSYTKSDESDDDSNVDSNTVYEPRIGKYETTTVIGSSDPYAHSNMTAGYDGGNAGYDGGNAGYDGGLAITGTVLSITMAVASMLVSAFYNAVVNIGAYLERNDKYLLLNKQGKAGDGYAYLYPAVKTVFRPFAILKFEDVTYTDEKGEEVVNTIPKLTRCSNVKEDNVYYIQLLEYINRGGEISLDHISQCEMLATVAENDNIKNNVKADKLCDVKQDPNTNFLCFRVKGGSFGHIIDVIMSDQDIADRLKTVEGVLDGMVQAATGLDLTTAKSTVLNVQSSIDDKISNLISGPSNVDRMIAAKEAARVAKESEEASTGVITAAGEYVGSAENKLTRHGIGYSQVKGSAENKLTRHGTGYSQVKGSAEIGVDGGFVIEAIVLYWILTAGMTWCIIITTLVIIPGVTIGVGIASVKHLGTILSMNMSSGIKNEVLDHANPDTDTEPVHYIEVDRSTNSASVIVYDPDMLTAKLTKMDASDLADDSAGESNKQITKLHYKEMAIAKFTYTMGEMGPPAIELLMPDEFMPKSMTNLTANAERNMAPSVIMKDFVIDGVPTRLPVMMYTLISNLEADMQVLSTITALALNSKMDPEVRINKIKEAIADYVETVSMSILGFLQGMLPAAPFDTIKTMVQSLIKQVRDFKDPKAVAKALTAFLDFVIPLVKFLQTTGNSALAVKEFVDGHISAAWGAITGTVFDIASTASTAISGVATSIFDVVKNTMGVGMGEDGYVSGSSEIIIGGSEIVIGSGPYGDVTVGQLLEAMKDIKITDEQATKLHTNLKRNIVGASDYFD